MEDGVGERMIIQHNARTELFEGVRTMLDFIVEKVIMPFLILLLLGVIIGTPILFIQHNRYEAFLKDCFMQEHKTKECEYALWKCENRTKTQTTVVPMPVVVR